MNISLTPKQTEAVENIFGPIMVIAGPGTGKTQVLSARIANILTKTDTHPWNILALTFTESGVQAMRERLLQFIGPSAYYVDINTFHSFALKTISEYEDKFIETAEFTVATPLEKIETIRNILESKSYKELKILDDPYFYVKRIEKALSILKRENISPEKLSELASVEKEEELVNPKNLYKKTGLIKPTELTRITKQFNKQLELSDIYKRYQASLKTQKKRDFDDLIIDFVTKLKEDEDLRLNLQEKYLFILVDEYQDTNNGQNDIVKALIQEVEKPNIFIVGDDDQSIYRFQGASVSNIINFEADLPETQIIVLTDNFRSTQTILDASEEVINHNQNRLSNILPGLEKHFTSHTKFSEEKIDVLKFSNNKLEAFYVAKKIKELINEGTKPDEICVIARKNSDLTDFAEELNVLEVPYSMTRDNNILDDSDIRKLITIFRLINNPYDDTLFFACLNFDFIKIPILQILKLKESAKTEGKSIFEFLCNNPDSPEQQEICAFKDKILVWMRESENMPFMNFFSVIIQETGFMDFMIDHPQKIEKINRVSTLFEEIKQKNYTNKSYRLQDFIDYIDLLYKYDIGIKEESIKTDIASVQLTTAHGSKGLEYEYVFIVKCIDKNWGNTMNNNDIKLPSEIVENSQVDKKERNEDERRLFYVALTRAKRKVSICYPEKITVNSTSSNCSPSMFINEVNDNVKTFPDPSVYEKNYLEHIIQKIEYVPNSSVEEKKYIENLIKNFKLNATALNTYLECSEKFKLNNLLKLPSVKTLRLSFGTAMHKAMENFYEKLKTGITPTLEMLQKYYEAALLNEVMTEDERNTLLEKGRTSLEGYYEKYKEEFSPAFHTEFDFKKRNIRFEGVQITGKLDRIDIIDQQKKTVRVIDYKTGRIKSRNEIEGKTKNADNKYKNQLLFYKLLIDSDKSLGYTAVEGELDFIEGKDGKFIKQTFEYDDNEMNQFKDLIRETIGKIKNQEFEKTADKSICEECPFNKICWGG